MLAAHRLSKSYGLHTVLNDLNLSLHPGERAGLIGPNGSGKTTLLRILAGRELPDSGSVSPSRPDVRIGYLPQGFELEPSLSLAEACQSPAGTPERAEHLASELAGLAAALAAHPGDGIMERRYEQTLLGLEQAADRPFEVLSPLGLADLPLETVLATLSGGQKTRLQLARLLAVRPNLLLLDEPTNHLDLGMLAWLEGWLARFHGAALIVSHDRAFLDNTVATILELDPVSHRLHSYAGNYSAYLEQKEAERSTQLQTYQDQQAEIRRMKADIARTRAQAAHTERQASSIRIGGGEYKVKGFKSYQQGIAKKVARKARAREKKLERYLTSAERVERPRPDWQILVEFARPDHTSRDVLVAEDLAIGYPGGGALLAGLRMQVRGGTRTALTGPNGSGKTTLLRTIAGELEPLAGTLRLSPSARVGMMSQEMDRLDRESTPLELVRRETALNETAARSLLHRFLFQGDDPLRPCGELSYGERARLELALLVARGCTFLLLDEPTNHLDIPSRVRFEGALAGYQGTVLAVIHDRYFIERFATELWTIEAGRLRKA